MLHRRYDLKMGEFKACSPRITRSFGLWRLVSLAEASGVFTSIAFFFSVVNDSHWMACGPSLDRVKKAPDNLADTPFVLPFSRCYGMVWCKTMELVDYTEVKYNKIKLRTKPLAGLSSQVQAPRETTPSTIEYVSSTSTSTSTSYARRISNSTWPLSTFGGTTS